MDGEAEAGDREGGSELRSGILEVVRVTVIRQALKFTEWASGWPGMLVEES
jgi:hypothetical protein